jgi:hypothetical protein
MGQESADKIFLTCIALHNWLLNEDGLDKDWEDGFQSNWEGPRGFHDIQDVEHHIPDAVWRLMSRTALRSYNVSGMGHGSDMRNQGDVTSAEHLEQGRPISVTTASKGTGTNNLAQTIRKVNDPTLHDSRSKLFRHFDVAFNRNEYSDQDEQKSTNSKAYLKVLLGDCYLFKCLKWRHHPR